MAEEKKIGRPKGARNKSIVVRTEAIRGAISVEECTALARELFELSMSRDIAHADKIKAMALLLRYIAHSADTELVVDAERSLSPEQIAQMKALIDEL